MVAAVSCGFVAAIPLTVAAQTSRASSNIAPIIPFRLSITCDKTTNLVFPYAIASVDRGTRDVLVQKALGVENVLQVKAGTRNFPETNMTVITTDGSLYTYVLDYADKPENQTLRFTGPRYAAAGMVIFEERATNDKIRREAGQILTRQRTVFGIRDKKFDMELSLTGIYLSGNEMYLQLDMKNNSAIGYKIGALRFFIRDQRQIRRAASQEREMYPVYTLGNVRQVAGHADQVAVIVLPKFTIPRKQYLVIRMEEKDGGRHLALKVNNHRLVSRAMDLAVHE